MNEEVNVQSTPAEMANQLPSSLSARQHGTVEHHVKMTSIEMGLLWASYLNDSLSGCMLKYFLQHIEDADICPILTPAVTAIISILR